MLAKALRPTDPPTPAPDIVFLAADGSRASPGGVPRPWHGGEPLGDLVRALRRGDAVAGRAVEARWRRTTSRCCRCHPTAAARRPCRPISRTTGSADCPCCSTRTAHQHTRGTCTAFRPVSSSTRRGARSRSWRAQPTGRQRRRRCSCGSWQAHSEQAARSPWPPAFVAGVRLAPSPTARLPLPAPCRAGARTAKSPGRAARCSDR